MPIRSRSSVLGRKGHSAAIAGQKGSLRRSSPFSRPPSPPPPNNTHAAMGFVKAYNLIRISAVAHMILGYILITAPQKIAKDTTIAILGEALGLVCLILPSPSPPLLIVGAATSQLLVRLKPSGLRHRRPSIHNTGPLRLLCRRSVGGGLEELLGRARCVSTAMLVERPLTVF